ncbi:MAG: hypothetical protein K8R23_03775 [Chthoniobacter sp.]|nr:hypothetical protein [Chthoniobacter sp.]
MRSIFLRFGHVLMLGALLQICGGHWLALQSLAWTEMLVSYSRDAAFVEAVAKTFDGQHPCGLCQSIEQGKKQEKRAVSEVAKAKLVFVVPTRTAVLWSAGAVSVQAVVTTEAGLLFEQPPVPPPRVAAV